jgi:hypothetical protein
VLSEFRARLAAGDQAERLLHRMLDRLRERGLLASGGRQRTDATHVLAAVRELNRLELVTETLRAALEALAAAAPTWLQGFVPEAASFLRHVGQRCEGVLEPAHPSSLANRRRAVALTGPGPQPGDGQRGPGGLGLGQPPVPGAPPVTVVPLLASRRRWPSRSASTPSWS